MRCGLQEEHDSYQDEKHDNYSDALTKGATRPRDCVRSMTRGSGRVWGGEAGMEHGALTDGAARIGKVVGA